MAGQYCVSVTRVTHKWSHQLIIVPLVLGHRVHLLGSIPRGTVRAARSRLNFHWFPPDCLCESGSQPPSIRKDVKYRARQTRIESGREGGGEGKEKDR